jgi:hypothetical protein
MRKKHTNQFPQIFLLSLIACMGGCGVARNPVPLDLIAKATIPGIPNARTMAGISNRNYQRTIVESIKQEGNAFVTGPDGQRSYDFLALSGGGNNGTYGAGLLCGWSAAGTRPRFKVVTGISTGSLLATSAFLGKDYDGNLKEAFTTVNTKDIMTIRSIFVLPYGDSIADTAPLARTIAKYHTNEMIDAVAREHRKGRRLFIGTTNLDADRFVIWDMGAIAASGAPKARELYRTIILASSSIPIVFPPMYIPVEVDGKRYDEMHVDGGVKAQVFLGGALLDISETARSTGLDPAKIKSRVFVIRNGKLRMGASSVKPKLVDIARKSLTSTSNFSVLGDLLRIFLAAASRGTEFNLGFIPEDYQGKAKEPFDPVEMTRLFNTGHAQAKAGYPWRKTPPGIPEDLRRKITSRTAPD